MSGRTPAEENPAIDRLLWVDCVEKLLAVNFLRVCVGTETLPGRTIVDSGAILIVEFSGRRRSHPQREFFNIIGSIRLYGPQVRSFNEYSPGDILGSGRRAAGMDKHYSIDVFVRSTDIGVLNLERTSLPA